MAKKFAKVTKGMNLQPQDTNPVNPREGGLYYSDGTFRAEGLWQYVGGEWISVGKAGGALSGGATSTKTANYTVVEDDNGKIIPVDISSGSVVITLPAVISGFVVTIKHFTSDPDVNKIYVDPGSVEIDGSNGQDILSVPFMAVSYACDGVKWTRFLGFIEDFTGTRGLFGGGDQSLGTDISLIQYINLASASNAIDFGNLTRNTEAPGALASRTRGCWGGGTSGPSNVIDYVTIATLGNAIDFGDLTVARNAPAGCGNDTRGLFGGGSSAGFHNNIDYITIATLGNAIDFGDLTQAGAGPSAASSTVRGIWAGRYEAPNGFNIIDYVTIATLGNAVDFGDLVMNRIYCAACSSATRMVIGGGDSNGSGLNTQIEYITMATTGNAANFGLISVPRWDLGAASSHIRGTWASGYENLGATIQSNVIDYVVIATLADAKDFGDLSTARDGSIGCSNAHGGLQ